MKVQVTDGITQFLREAAEEPQLPNDIKELAKTCIGEKAIDWETLKSVSAVVNGHRGGTASPLHRLCRGGGLVLEAPPRRQSTKSPELQAHLDRLRVKLEQDKYDAMVAEVTVEERAAVAASEGGFVTYKQQISFGIHVIVMMGAFYIFGHLMGMAITRNKTYHPAVGMAFMVLAMILETVLYVIRTTVPPKLHDFVEERAQKKREASLKARSEAADTGEEEVGRLIDPIEAKVVEEIEPLDDIPQSLADKKVN